MLTGTRLAAIFARVNSSRPDRALPHGFSGIVWILTWMSLTSGDASGIGDKCQLVRAIRSDLDKYPVIAALDEERRVRPAEGYLKCRLGLTGKIQSSLLLTAAPLWHVASMAS